MYKVRHSSLLEPSSISGPSQSPNITSGDHISNPCSSCFPSSTVPQLLGGHEAQVDRFKPRLRHGGHHQEQVVRVADAAVQSEVDDGKNPSLYTWDLPWRRV